MVNSCLIIDNQQDFCNPKGSLYGQIRQTFSKGEVFIRPNNGWKPFSGHLYDPKEMEGLQMPDSTLCLISSAKKILEEYRFVVIEKDIISGSSYMNDEVRVEENDDVFDFAQTVVHNIVPPDLIYTLDVAITKKGPRIIETNCFNSSGLYAADIPKTWGYERMG